jgi:hypothetical protein
MNRIHILIGILGISLLLGLPAAPTAAQTGERCFDETGYCISGVILDYWESNGGLPVFGYPITQQEGASTSWGAM